MNKFMRLVALVMVLVSVLAFAACQPSVPDTTESTQSSAESTQSTQSTAPSTEPERKVTFRVKIVDEAGNTVAGVGVQLCKADGTCTTRDTNEEGWAEFDNDVEDGYTANIAYLADYTEVNSPKQTFESGVTEMTLTLTVTYRIKVVDAEGKPVEGETVTLVNKDKFAYTKGVTDAEGYAVFYNQVAEGYNACFGDHSDMKVDGVELFPFEAEASEITLTKAAE